MAGQRKPYNPNTKYGRRKRREQALQTYNSLSPEKKAEWDLMGCIIMLIILVVIGGLIFFISGPEALAKWLSR